MIANKNFFDGLALQHIEQIEHKLERTTTGATINNATNNCIRQRHQMMIGGSTHQQIKKGFLYSETIEEKIQRTKESIYPNDVLCGRGKTSFNHVGNRQFRDTIISSLTEYNNAKSRYDKSKVVGAIVQNIRSTGGRFLKREQGKWVELNDRKAKEKVGHAIRDAISLIECGGKKPKKTIFASKRQLSSASTGQCSSTEDDCYSSSLHSTGIDESASSSLEESNSSLRIKSSEESNSSLRIKSSSDNKQNHESTNFDVNDDNDDFLSKINDVLGPMTIDDSQQNDPVDPFLELLENFDKN